MILVTIGTYEAPFDRLLAAVGELAGDHELTMQCGPSAVRPAGATCFDYMPFDGLCELIREAETVITHGGAGSVLLSLAEGKKPVVVPRLARYGEAVDDHQVPFARRLAAAGLITLVEDPSDLAAALRERSGSSSIGRGDAGALTRDLAAHLAEVVRG